MYVLASTRQTPGLEEERRRRRKRITTQVYMKPALRRRSIAAADRSCAGLGIQQQGRDFHDMQRKARCAVSDGAAYKKRPVHASTSTESDKDCTYEGSCIIQVQRARCLFSRIAPRSQISTSGSLLVSAQKALSRDAPLSVSSQGLLSILRLRRIQCPISVRRRVLTGNTPTPARRVHLVATYAQDVCMATHTQSYTPCMETTRLLHSKGGTSIQKGSAPQFWAVLLPCLS